MPNELRNPADHVHRNRDSIDTRLVCAAQELVGSRRGAEDKWRDADAGDVRGQREVQGGVGYGSESAEVEGEVEAVQERGCADREGGGVGALM